MSKLSKSALNTLSETRQRIVPSTFDFAGLTLNLEKAAAKARGSSDANVRRQFEPSKRSSLLDRLASRPPGASARPATPVMNRQNSNREGRRAPARISQASPEDNRKLNATRSRLSLPNPRTSESTGSARPVSEYTREISSLDKLAAEAGTGGSGAAATIRPRRSYKDRLETRPETQRPQTSTRFSLPNRPLGASQNKRPGSQVRQGDSPARRQTRAQEEEEARRSAIEARKSAARPQPVPYSFDGLDVSSFSPVLSTLNGNGSSVNYRKFQELTRDERDPVRLVAGNRSIIQKATVLKKIDTWIPPLADSQSEARA